MKRKTYLVCVFLFICAIGCIYHKLNNNSSNSNRDKQIEQARQNYRQAVKEHPYIMHALGGIDETHTYTNSIDALEKAYQDGERLFEVDISTTLDGELVLAHCNGNGTFVGDGEINTWNKTDWEERLGQTYDENHPLATYQEFMSFRIQGEYTATDYKMLVAFAREHEDTYFTIDVGNRSYGATKEIYTLIVDEADQDEKVLDRFNVGGQNLDMLRAEKEVYDFPIMYLYYGDEESRENEVYSAEDFLKYCRDNDILCYATSQKIYKESNLNALVNSDLIGFVYTIDDELEAKEILADGVDCVGTNFLR